MTGGSVVDRRAHETIAEGILRETARMRKEGSFETGSLCWGAADMEALAMFAIDAKNRLRAEREKRESLERLAKAEGWNMPWEDSS